MLLVNYDLNKDDCLFKTHDFKLLIDLVRNRLLTDWTIKLKK